MSKDDQWPVCGTYRTLWSMVCPHRQNTTAYSPIWATYIRQDTICGMWSNTQWIQWIPKPQQIHGTGFLTSYTYIAQFSPFIRHYEICCHTSSRYLDQNSEFAAKSQNSTLPEKPCKHNHTEVKICMIDQIRQVRHDAGVARRNYRLGLDWSWVPVFNAWG